MEQRLTAAFVLSLLAGFWMLGSGGMIYGMAHFGGSWMPSAGMMPWMWHQGMMRGFHPALWWPWFGFVAGIIVLVSSGMLYARSGSRGFWGLVILFVSALDTLIGMGGILAGALGVIGGSLALATSPK